MDYELWMMDDEFWIMNCRAPMLRRQVGAGSVGANKSLWIFPFNKGREIERGEFDKEDLIVDD